MPPTPSNGMQISQPAPTVAPSAPAVAKPDPRALRQQMPMGNQTPPDPSLIPGRNLHATDQLSMAPPEWQLRIDKNRSGRDGQLLNICIVAANIAALGRGYGETLAVESAGDMGLIGRPAIRNTGNPFPVDAETGEHLAVPKAGCHWAKVIQLSTSV